MPVYGYICNKCQKNFELFFTFSQYNECPKCIYCSSEKTCRSYIEDVKTINMSVKKSDSELKTVGDLANRNRDKLSEDEKNHLFNKHNSYKEEPPEKPLPNGMKRIQKTKKKIKWT